ncbi:MAG: hypothetical protein JWR77_26, partial [Rhizorhabdus sp.]|nr:hypothetical protein [Rhizorhabdus sp.]
EHLNELLNPQNQKSISGILANVDRLTGALANRGNDIAAALAQTKVAIEQVGAAAQQIGTLAETTNGVVANDVRPAMANLNKATDAARHTMESLDSAITDARPGLKAFSTRTVPEVNHLVRNLGEMSESLNAVAAKLDHGGAGALVGGAKLPDYKPKN